MINNFVTLDSLGNFTIQMIVIVIATEFTKKLLGNKIKLFRFDFKIKTEVVVFFYSLLLAILNSYGSYKLEHVDQHILVTIVLILINAVVISYIASASYSKIVSNYEERHKDIKSNGLS